MAMSLHYTRAGGRPVDGSAYIAMSKELKDIYADEMKIAGLEGVAEAKAFIDIAGTGRTWSGFFPGANGRRDAAGEGRRDTDTMRDKVDYRIVRGIDIGLDVGWINFWMEYFGAQDAGFFAGGFRPGQTVEGMGMLAHLKMYMRDRVDEALDRADRRIVNGL